MRSPKPVSTAASPYALDIRSDDRLRAFVDALPFIVWQAAPDGRVTFLNAAWRAYTGLDADEALGHRWQEAVPPDDYARAPWRTVMAPRAAQPYRVDLRVRSAHGAYRWFAVDATPIHDRHGDVVRWVGTCTDIDDRIRAADALRETAARSAFLAHADEIISRSIDADAILQAVTDAAVASFADDCSFEVTSDAATAISRERMQASGVRSVISVAVAARGTTYGVLTFGRGTDSPPFEDDDRRTAEDLARRVATALENANLYAEARRTAEAQRTIAAREKLYARLGEALAHTLNLHETLGAAVDLLVPELADCAMVTLLDDAQRAYLAAAQHVDPVKRDFLAAMIGHRYAAGEASFGARRVIRNGEPVVARFSEDMAPGRTADVFRTLGLTSSLIVPIVYNGIIKGTLHVLRGGGAGAAFGNADVPSYVEIARRISPAIGNAEAYARERHVAQSFQTAALRIELPVVPGFAFDAIYEAGKSEALVGGDWYDAFVLGDGRVVLSIGDVVGSGLEAAIAMVNVRQTIRGVAQVHPDPALMLQAADRTVRTQYPERFVTAFAAVLDPITKQGSYANAGHPPALLRAPSGVVVELNARSLPLGLIDDATIDVAHFGIEAGCTLLLYTDGLIESDRDPARGTALLRAAFADDPGGDGAIRRIYHRALTGTSSDDVAMLLVSSAASGDLRRWRFDPFWRDAVERVRTEVVAVFEAAGIGGDRTIDVEIVFAELLSNQLRYSYGTVDLFVERNEANVVLHLLDNGPGFRFNPRLPSDPMSESGRGLFLIDALSSQFSVDHRPGGGSHARIVFNVDVERNHSYDRS